MEETNTLQGGVPLLLSLPMRRFAALLLGASVFLTVLPPETSAAVDHRPLRVRLETVRAHELILSLNRPAYVAIFEVDPLWGARRVAPIVETHQRLDGGSHVVPVYPSRSVRAGLSELRYFYVLASETPLRDLERFYPHRFTPIVEPSIYGVTSEIEGLLLDDPWEEGWDSDLIPVWRGEWDEPAPRRWVTVRCPDGREVFLPEGAVLRCPHTPETKRGRPRWRDPESPRILPIPREPMDTRPWIPARPPRIDLPPDTTSGH